MIGRTHRPCGACGRYVAATGCRHWQPRIGPEGKWRAAEQRAKQQAAEAVAAFREAMGR